MSSVPKKLVPEWSPELLMKIRRVVRHGGQPADIRTLLPVPMTEDSIRERCKKLGMQFAKKNGRAHEGTSKLSI